MPFPAIAMGVASIAGKLLKKNPATGKSVAGTVVKKAGGLFGKIFKKKNKSNPSPIPVLNNEDVMESVASGFSGISKKVLKQAKRDTEYSGLEAEQSKNKGVTYAIYGGIAFGVLILLGFVLSMFGGRRK